MAKVCTVEGCGRAHRARGLCWTHHKRLMETGKTGGPVREKAKDGVKLAWLKEHASMAFTDECLIWPFPLNGGRGVLVIDGVTCRAHRAMCEEAHGSATTPGHEAAHSCGKGHLGCVHPKHLRWATPAENQSDRLLHGTDVRGEKHPMNVLSKSQVLEIKAMRSAGSTSPEVARKFNISDGHVRRICAGRAWKHLKGEVHVYDR